MYYSFPQFSLGYHVFVFYLLFLSVCVLLLVLCVASKYCFELILLIPFIPVRLYC